MRSRSALILVGCSLLCVACTKQVPSESPKETLKNPLTAEQYWADTTEMYVQMLVGDEDVKNNPKKMADMTNRKNEALAASRTAADVRKKGLLGSFVNAKQLVSGSVLLLDQQLFFGTDFLSNPGPNLHVYLTTVTDPRDVSFPDDTAMDLGVLKSPYGDQAYTVPGETTPTAFRTVTLYDQSLGRIYGFVQLSEQR